MRVCLFKMLEGGGEAVYAPANMILNTRDFIIWLGCIYAVGDCGRYRFCEVVQYVA